MSCLLRGLDGRNPCGFLAALGTLRLLTDHVGRGARLSWAAGEAGALNPTISLGEERSEDEIAQLVLGAHLERDLEAELGWERDVMKLGCERARELLATSLADPGTVRAAQTIGGCVVDVPRRHGRRIDPSRPAGYTPLRVIPRMGRARFVGTALSVSRSVTKERQVRIALFGPWKYEKANSLRWDPAAPPSLRAYSAEAPTDFGPLGVPGAVALAVAGLCYLPLVAAGGGAACAGFAAPRASVLRWPLWRQPLDEPAVRLTLGIPALHAEHPDDALLGRYGILARVSAGRQRLGDDNEVLSWGDTHLVHTGPSAPPSSRPR